MTANACRTCGKSIGRGASQCGTCGRKRAEAARSGHQYARTHVHQWDDGRLTIELGTASSCACQGAALSDEQGWSGVLVRPEDDRPADRRICERGDEK